MHPARVDGRGQQAQRALRHRGAERGLLGLRITLAEIADDVAAATADQGIGQPDLAALHIAADAEGVEVPGDAVLDRGARRGYAQAACAERRAVADPLVLEGTAIRAHVAHADLIAEAERIVEARPGVEPDRADLAPAG